MDFVLFFVGVGLSIFVLFLHFLTFLDKYLYCFGTIIVSWMMASGCLRQKLKKAVGFR